MTHSFTVSYETHPQEFSSISKKYGSDKGSPIDGEVFGGGWKYHAYTDFYEHFFGPWRHHIKNIFECGIGTTNLGIKSNMGHSGSPGASLRMWKELFPNANVYGADIDTNVLFTEDRIKTYPVDQTDKESVRLLSKSIPTNLDVIIDDGLHSAQAAITLFEGVFDNLRPGGVYIVEDVWNMDNPWNFRKNFIEYLVKESIDYSLVELSREYQHIALILIYKKFA